MFALALSLAGLASGQLLGGLIPSGEAPIVETSYARFQGKNDLVTSTSNYLGIPYARAPRFDHAQLFNETLEGVQQATEYGDVCPQHLLVPSIVAPDIGEVGEATSFVEALPLAQDVYKQSEDCLSINVQRPQDQNLKDLPVLLWIHGGGFEVGASAALGVDGTTALPGVFYQGANIVKRSVAEGKPILFTSINYRLHHFGFTASREFEQAGILNLGLEDQRVAMRWIQQNIRAFGGDPSKVTIMGESAGSWSVTGHLVANEGNNEGLFRAAVGISGGPLAVDGPERQQDLFDDMVRYVGCDGASDKIACLRQAPYAKIFEHANTVNNFFGFRSLASAWTLRPDGKFLTESPDKLVAAGKIANVPIMYGDMENEGTLFSLINPINITTTELVKDYFKTYWWPKVTEPQLDRLMELYPTSIDNFPASPLPQYERLSALIGDYSFEAQRRSLLAKVSAPKWNYVTAFTVPLSVIGDSIVGKLLGQLKATKIPYLGSFHASDVFFYFFGTIPDTISNNSRHLMGSLVHFVHDLDPNHDEIPQWPQWDSANLESMHFREQGLELIKDDYRKEGMDYINEIKDSIRI
ncbi:putative carboxylesterase, type B, carboxylesterase type B, active, alpha/Beta hydrolase [Septoria linicola]|nr:putative carboxylesterase, type B, carboxylesterase type B, active, alpha/Beta hydrolase [Septoria linicola]